MNDETLVGVTHVWLDDLPLRCLVCAAPLFPGNDGTVACDGEQAQPHSIVIYCRMEKPLHPPKKDTE